MRLLQEPPGGRRVLEAQVVRLLPEVDQIHEESYYCFNVNF